MPSYRKKGRVWYYRFVDGDGIPRERAGCNDKRATEELARDAESEAARVRAGLLDPRELARREHEARPLAAHLGDFIATLNAKGNDPRYVHQVRAHVARIVEQAGAERISDLTPPPFKEP